ncbi:hypothetical protein [Staphylococcus debuckii]|uniref:hypothetical protein n=1 Tax=Staphylococcus debuckii TaxID=2044912 RepID=UPI000F433DAD|nr:hypothetical protein [Staphylococcus debuckii]AYU54246.1 hypothetical protein CNQ82_01835 [Staphylococcus debuckii]
MKRLIAMIIRFMFYFDIMFLFEYFVFDDVNYLYILGLALALAIFTEIGNPRNKKKKKNDDKKK